jgi:hypothetical protein
MQIYEHRERNSLNIGQKKVPHRNCKEETYLMVYTFFSETPALLEILRKSEFISYHV